MDGHGYGHPVASGAINTDGSAQTQGSNRNHGNEIPRARRSVVDRFLRKEEALGSNPSESMISAPRARSRAARIIVEEGI